MNVGKKMIVIADSDKTFRSELICLLEEIEGISVVAEAEDGLGVVRVTEEFRPDLLLTDISMPRMSGLEAIYEIRKKKKSPETKVLVLTSDSDEDNIFTAFEQGAYGYCLKDAIPEELLHAIRSVLAGKTYLSPGVSQKVVEGYLESRHGLIRGTSWGWMTHREKQVLKLVAEGYKSKEIGDFLNIKAKTVENHKASIMKKLDIHTASAMRVYATHKGLVWRPKN